MNKRYPKGLTLAELLLAAAILAFVLCGLLLLFINCSFLNEGNRNLTVAMTHAQCVMEEIRNEVALQDIRDDIDKQGGHHGWDWDADDINNRGLQALPNETINTCCLNAGYTACLAACQDINPLGVLVKVEWDDAGKRHRDDVELMTKVAEYQ